MFVATRTDIDPENPQYEQYVTGMVNSLITELENKAASFKTEDLFLTKLKLVEAAKMFRVSILIKWAYWIHLGLHYHLNTSYWLLQQRYSHNPANLFRIIRHCLCTEMKLVSQVENLSGSFMNMAGGRVGMMVGDAVAEIAQQVETLRRRTQETGEDLRKMEQEQEAFAISYHECTKLNATLQHMATQPQNHQSIDLEKKIQRYTFLLLL